MTAAALILAAVLVTAWADRQGYACPATPGVVLLMLAAACGG